MCKQARRVFATDATRGAAPPKAIKGPRRRDHSLLRALAVPRSKRREVDSRNVGRVMRKRLAHLGAHSAGDSSVDQAIVLYLGWIKPSNAAFCCKGSHKLAVNGAARSAAQLHSVPQCLWLQQRSLEEHSARGLCGQRARSRCEAIPCCSPSFRKQIKAVLCLRRILWRNPEMKPQTSVHGFRVHNGKIIAANLDLGEPRFNDALI